MVSHAHQPPVLAAVASAVPGAALRQDILWDEHFAQSYGGDTRARRIWLSAGVETRHGVVDPRVEDVAAWGTQARIERFISEAVPLGTSAVERALALAGVPAGELGMFAVVSCTGYATPGLDILLARDLGMPASVQRLAIGHMGCYAALPGLAAVGDFVVAQGRPACLLCCELTSLHVQGRRSGGGRLSPDEVGQLVAHALFADGAAAAVLVPDDSPHTTPDWGRLVDTEVRTDPATASHMTWDVTDHGFRMGLSPRVPDVLARHVVPTVTALLGRHELTGDDIDTWAVHPGGPKILQVVAEQLRLPAGALNCSEEVLRTRGNCSSATVLMVLERLHAQRPAKPGWTVLLAFGPGLTLYASLLRRGPART